MSEFGQFDFSIDRTEDVVTFYIPMSHICRVEECERTEHLLEHECDVEFDSVARREDVSERSALDEFHHNVEPVLVQKHPNDLYNARMLQFLLQGHLVLDHRALLLMEINRLNGDHFTALGQLSAVNRRRSAGANLPDIGDDRLRVAPHEYDIKI
jgi:hypothetical protein